MTIKGKKIETVLSFDTPTDAKHINNTSTKKVPMELLEAVEKGCTLETLEQLAGTLPVYKYTTQITVHGIFPELTTNRVGRYVNLCQNKNKSVGIRYTAIDHEKKCRLFNLLRVVGGWSVEETSTSFSAYKLQEATKENYQAAKEAAAKIDQSLFIGRVDCYVLQTICRSYVVTELVINCFYERNFKELACSVLGMDWETIQATKAQKDQEAAAKRKEEEAYWNQKHEQWEQEKKEKESKLELFIETTPAPAGFSKKTDYTLQVGNIIALVNQDYNGNCSWCFRIVRKNFGKLSLAPCDQLGNVTGRGTELLRPTRKQCIVK